MKPKELDFLLLKDMVELLVEDTVDRFWKIHSGAASTGQILDEEARRMAYDEALEWFYKKFDEVIPDED